MPINFLNNPLVSFPCLKEEVGTKRIRTPVHILKSSSSEYLIKPSAGSATIILFSQTLCITT